ncbi:MAG: hypothetical protein ACAI25_20100 [Planctomycetota bacterium]
MKKLAIAVMAVLGLVIFAAQSNACSTHGYVRASTLNDLFQGVANNDNGLVFEAPNSNGDGAGGTNLSDPNLDTGHYDDGHSFGWKMKGANDDNWVHLATEGNVQAQLDQIIAAIEQGLSEKMDVNFAD